MEYAPRDFCLFVFLRLEEGVPFCRSLNEVNNLILMPNNCRYIYYSSVFNPVLMIFTFLLCDGGEIVHMAKIGGFLKGSFRHLGGMKNGTSGARNGHPFPGHLYV